MLAGMALCVCAGDFAAPALGPVAFRRDRIPLNVDAMAGLSQNLEMLARALPGKAPAQRQTAARMLALALVLDPANARARELLAIYQKGRHKPQADAVKLRNGLAKTWQLVAWLETPEAGQDGQALANCLKDVLVISDPKHPQAAAWREAGEKGAWAGWIPGLEAYGALRTTAGDGMEIRPAAEGGIPLEKARVRTVLWCKPIKDERAGWELGPALLRMTATKDENAAFSIVLGSGEMESQLAPQARMLENLLAAQNDPVPHGVRVQIACREYEQAPPSGMRQSCTAAAAVLASAAVTGREPEAYIIGQVDESGAFDPSAEFWDELQALYTGKGRRLILPAAAADWLPSLLAMENPGFFMGYEVLLAEDFRQLLDLSAKTPEGEVAVAMEKFREIRERVGTQDVSSYLENRFVVQRLEELAESAPFHASAAMLLAQAKDTRPTLVKREVLAAELRRATSPMVWIAGHSGEDFSDEEIKKLGETHDLCRPGIDRMERYAEKTDLDLLERARAVVLSLRNLARGENSHVRGGVRTARADFVRLYAELAEDLGANAAAELEFPER